MSAPSVITLTPSRGLLHSRMVEATLAALTEASGQAQSGQVTGQATISALGWLFTHDLPIPDCHEVLAQRGLATGADLLWFVEEDMAPPPTALTALVARMRATDADVVTLDYPVGESPATQRAVTTHPSDGSVWWCGLGCTLIKRAVFARLAPPWFDTRHTHLLTSDGAAIATLVDTPTRYGGQDVSFCLAARAAGLRLDCVPHAQGTAAHLRLRTWGAAGVNDGAHTIDTLRLR